MAWMAGIGRALDGTTKTISGTLFNPSQPDFRSPKHQSCFPIDQLTLGQDTLPRETSKEVIDGPAGLAGS